jgi:hypothetical protein
LDSRIKINPRKNHLSAKQAEKSFCEDGLDGFATMPGVGFRSLFSCLAILSEKWLYLQDCLIFGDIFP